MTLLHARRTAVTRISSTVAAAALLLLGVGPSHAASASAFSASTSQSPSLGVVRTSTAVTTTVTMTATAAATTSSGAVSMVDPDTGNAASSAWTAQLSTCSSKSFSVDSTCTFNVRFYSANKGSFSARAQLTYTAGGTTRTESVLFTATAASTPGAVSNLTAVATSRTTANVSWNPPADNGNSAITEYRLNVTNSSTSEVTDYLLAPTSSPYSLTGLTLGVTYTIKMYARNVIGESLLTNASSFPFVLPTPSAPSNLQASNVRSSTLTLSWSPVTGFVDGYRVQVSTSGYYGPYDDVTSTAETSVNLTDLDPETGYFFKVFAYNISRNGSESIIAVQTRDALPHAPTDVTITDTTLNSITLTWTAPLEDVDGYVVETSLDGATWDEVGGPDGTETTFTIADLDPDTFVFVRVHAFNGNGDGAPSPAIFASTLSGRPNPVTQVSALPLGETRVKLDWVEPDPALVPVSGYLIQSRRVLFSDAGAEFEDWEDIDEVDSTTLTFTVVDLTPCTNQDQVGCPQTEYRVLALSEFGQSDPGTTVYADPLFYLPSPVVDVDATAIAPGKVTLTWSPSSDGSSPVSGYQVFYSTDTADLACDVLTETGGCDLAADSVATTDTAVTIEELDSDSTYYFAVLPLMQSEAFDEVPGTMSNIASADVPADIDVVSGVAVSDVSDSGFSVTWDAMTSAWGGTSYTVQISADEGDSWTTVATTSDTYTTVTGLDSGQFYLVQVIANDDFITAEPSEPAEVTTLLRAATALTVTHRSEDSVSLQWSAPEGTAVVTGYRIQSRSVLFSEAGSIDGDWADVDEVDADTFTYTVGDLQPCVEPADLLSFDPVCPVTEYRVVAFNDNVTAEPTDSVQADPDFALPGLATDVSATVIASGTATVSWAPAADGTSPVGGYVVYYSTDETDFECAANEFGGCDIGADSVETTDTAITIEELEPGETYYFIVVPVMASPAFGDILGRASASASADIPPVIESPTALEVDSASFTRATVTWSESPSDYGPVTYIVQISDDEGDTWSDAAETTETSATLTDLTEGTLYLVQVIARDAFTESEPSESVELQMKSYDKPATPIVSDFYVEDQIGYISFDLEEENNATNVTYRATLQEDLPGGRLVGTVMCDVEALECQIPGAATGTPYRIQIVGWSDGGHVIAPWYRHTPPPIALEFDSGPNVLVDDEVTVEISELRPGYSTVITAAGKRDVVVGDEDGFASYTFTAKGRGKKNVNVKMGARKATGAVWVVTLTEPKRVKAGRPLSLRIAGAMPGTTITLVPSIGEEQTINTSTGKASFSVTLPTVDDSLDYSVLLDDEEYFSGTLSVG